VDPSGTAGHETPEPLPPPVVRPGAAPPALVRTDGAGHIAQDLTCPCGTNLRGTAIAATCPGCRRAINAVPRIELDADGHILADVLCRGCGYDLRGLPPRGRCPECETAIERSVLGDFLRFSEPSWVDRLARGMTWIICGVFTAIGSVVIGVIGVMLLTAIITAATAQQGGAPGLWPFFAGGTLIAFVTLVAAAMIVYGVWHLTALDPGEPPAAGVSARILARYGMLVYLVAGPLNTFFGFRSSALGGVSGWVPWLGVALLVIAIVPMVATYVHARRLAGRIPDERLVRQGTIVLWGMLVAKVLEAVTLAVTSAVVGVMGNLTAGGAPPTGGLGLLMATYGLVGCLATLSKAVFGIWTIVVMFMFRDALRKAANAARSGWAGEASAPPT